MKAVQFLFTLSASTALISGMTRLPARAQAPAVRSTAPSIGAQPSKATEPSRTNPRDNGIAPAEVLSEIRLGPAAGNGTRPFTAAVDTRRNQLWVLNRGPQSLSVINIATRSVIGTVALTSPAVPDFDGYENTEARVWMNYDARSDHMVICNGNSATPSLLLSINAGTRRLAALRTFTDRLFYCCAFNAKRSEVVAAAMGRDYRKAWGLLTLDAKTLKTRADFAMNRQTEALAASARTGQLYSVEPSNPEAARIGIGGPYSANRVYVRDAMSGAIVAQSADEYPYPRALMADDANERIYLAHGNTEEVRGKGKSEDLWEYSSTDATTVSVLSQITLKTERDIHYASPNPDNGRHYLHLGNLWLDAPRRRLICWYGDGKLAILPLTGPAKATEVPVDGSMFSECHLGGILPRTGQPILLIDNAVRLLNTRTLQPVASITMGATIQNLFLDGKRHRLLAYVDRGVHEFTMLENGSSRRLFKSYLLPRTRLLAVDFDREVIYHVYDDSWGNAASLEVMNFRGEPTAGGYNAEGEFSAMILTDAPGRTFRLLQPGNPESVRVLRRCSLDLVENGRETRGVVLQWSAPSQLPSQLLYAAQADRLYLAFGASMTVYAGSDLSTDGTVSLAAVSGDRVTKYGEVQGSLAVDATGQFAYYADPRRKQIVKLSLADGSIAATRALTFAPSLPRVDSVADRLYVADNSGGRVVAIRLF